ncbi:Mg2+ transporter protein, CorA-like [Penicillium camemberti]|uniref:Mg2+ transporter protein, CorA-like n=1 Tax=Penicillium camemberti (strain FM 013) TaxID=1429867 RepID=A0A0G4PRV0_PENC3|nr:Mg2+ transporter protein, CorA-like [Penicillium camemberti]
MAESLARTPSGLPRSRTLIDLEDMAAQTVRGRRQIRQRNQSLASMITRLVFRGDSDSDSDSNFDEILKIVSGEESLKKDYLKITGRPNLGLVEQIFTYKATDAEELTFERNDTWSACFERLRSAAEKNDNELEICLVTSDTTHLGRAFSFIHRIFFVGHDRFQQAYSLPSQIVIRILHNQWKFSDEIMARITGSLCPKEGSLSAWQPKLPSQLQIESSVQVPLKFAFEWIDAPYYTTDLSVYVLRPYGRYPQAKTLDVILTSMQYDQIRRAIVVVNSHNTLAELHNLLPEVFQHEVSGLPYILRLFRALCVKTTAETVTFLTKTCDDINYMVYEGRLRPSGSKMQYLRHLEDCHHVAKDCCQKNRCTLQVLLDQVNLIQGPRTDDETNLINELEMARNDLEYLHDEIESSVQRIPGVCRDIREQLDFVQIRRTNILGILAGLYLPLAFVTSFLGMNLEQYTQLQPSWRNTTRIDPTNPDNITISHSEIVDSGANQAWPLELFFEIAVPLMVGTILIPLVIGSIIRVFLRALGRGRTWWRLIFASFVVGSVTITLKSFDALIANGRCRSYSTLASICSSYFTAGDIGAGILGGVYGISLFLVWWWKPHFYYRWDQGRRQKSKES